MSYPRWSTLSLLPERTVAGLPMNINQQHKGYVALKWTSNLHVIHHALVRTGNEDLPPREAPF